MPQLQINLTGTINSTNFDEWKSDLIAKIQSVNRNLVTDNDFDEASTHVKSFKAAEKALKNAKQSAINQAQEIQQLFSSIDEITEEARQARLSLERQIKARKKEIKEDYIQSGIDTIKAVIEEQSVDLAACGLSHYLDRSRYESAVYGKAGIRGLERGINQVTSVIQEEITEKVRQINNNKVKLDSIIEGYKVLFQDYSQLMFWPSEQLDREIDKRITRYESEIKAGSEVPVGIPQKEEAEETIPVVDGVIPKKGKYRIIIQLEATSEEANNIRKKIENDYSAWIRNIMFNPDE